MRMPDDIEKCPVCGREGYNFFYYWICPYLDCATDGMQIRWDRHRNLSLDEMWVVMDEYGEVVSLHEEYCWIEDGRVINHYPE